MFTPQTKRDGNISDEYDLMFADDSLSLSEEEKRKVEAKTYACIQQGIEFATAILSENGLKSVLW